MKCDRCLASAVEFDLDGTGYCLRCWQGCLGPGALVAEKIYRQVEGSLKRFWICGDAKVVDPKTWGWALKPLKANGFVYIYSSAFGRVCQVQRDSLIEVRPGMPKLMLNTFSEVFGTKSTPAPELPVAGIKSNKYRNSK
jgi:hypothetical protein